MASDLIVAARDNRLGDVERLLQEGADIDATDGDYGQTPISWAAERGHLDVVKTLYERGASLLIADRNGWYPTDWAVRNSRTDVVSFFLTRQQDASHRYYKGRGLLFVAAQRGSVEDVNRFVGGEPDQVDSDGTTPLMAASQNGRFDNVVVLLKAGADPLRKNEDQRTAFYWAAKEGHTEVIRALLTEACAKPRKISELPNDEAIAFAFAEKGEDEEWNEFLDTHPHRAAPEEGDRTSTALHFAAQHGIEKAVQRMLALPSDAGMVNAQDAQGRTPLIWASMGGHLAIVDALLQHHANPKLSDDEYKETALMWAAENGHGQVVERLCRELDRHDVNVRGWRGYTAMTFAASRGNAAGVRALIEAGADLSIVDDRWGQSPLSWAAEGNYLEAVTDLIKAEADLYAESHGNTPVSFALDNLEILRAFIQQPRDTMRDGGEKIPRVRVIELALRYSCNLDDDTFSDTPDLFILDQKEYLEAVDHDGRNLASWAAQGGSPKEMDMLRAKRLDFNSKDNIGRTSLHWAAEGGNRKVVKWLLHEQVAVDTADEFGRTPLSRAAVQGHDKCVRMLVDRGAHPDSPNKNRRTPLSLAAEKGHVEVVNLLLSLRDGKTKTSEGVVNRSKKGHGGIGARDGGAGAKDRLGDGNKDSTGRTGPDNGGAAVAVDSRDVEERTPLWYAAIGHHLTVFKTLRANGADPGVMDKSGKALHEILVNKKSAGGVEPEVMAALDAMLEQLRSAQALLSKPLDGAADLDEEFKATILRVPENEKLELESRTQLSVHSLLRGEGLPDPQGASCAWMHLPANNMRWVEVLMTRHYEACGESERWNASVVLQSKLWEQQQHKSRRGAHYARFMRPACHRFVLVVEDKGTSSSQGLVLFMPYLHWEPQNQQRNMKEIMNLKKEERKAKRDLILADPSLKDPKGTEKLHWVYLDEEHPLHVRRTLDQYYYHTLPNTEERDNDQTGIRYHNDHLKSTDPKQANNPTPVLTMVDQLWMWVLPRCGKLPPTIITAFPQRSNRMRSGGFKNMTALVSNIIAQFQETPERTVDGLAKVIAAECSRIYFDTMSNRDESLQFSEIYTTSMGGIVSNPCAPA
ncbi:ankyrin repeat-containing domain protein [Chaetomium fimeti]|uniref:Ankyrin repeat-containing domain protein n=1 Tax=Chaetomium fimeti TaxID=1854472 RepID=A0AAE0H7W7_9PEZI|nr:ankyrin repeat-containing domain protein [Chaetomium fimeti]